MKTEKKLNVRETLSKSYSRKLTPDESGGFVATIHEFPGCIAHGFTADEAVHNLENAAEAWLEAADESSYLVPEPANYDSASGRIALRISRRLHILAAERADLEGVSLNQLISTALATYVGQQDGITLALNVAKEQLESACTRFAALQNKHTFQSFYVNLYSSHHSSQEDSRKFIGLQTKKLAWDSELLSSSPSQNVVLPKISADYGQPS